MFVKHRSNGNEIFLDVSDVKTLTIDAIMYTLALISNLKYGRGFKYYFSGNVPKYDGPKELMEQSGFFNYVKSNNVNFKTNSKYMQIRTGFESDGEIASKIVDFARAKYGLSKSRMNYLYKMLIELMANAKNHAYDNSKNIMKKRWYVFVEDTEAKLSFTFLDTGIGIPNTVHKKIGEKIKELLSEPYREDLKIRDVDYILSALDSKTMRTKTQLAYRGKGLPKINQIFENGKIQELSIISGRGFCACNGEQYDMNISLNGTLFYWEIC